MDTQIKTKRTLALTMAAVLSTTAAPVFAETMADVIFHNGNVITVNEDFDVVQAVAIKGNEIIAVGSNEEAMSLAGDATKVIDVNGATVMPGINDSHIHVLPLGFAMQSLALQGKPLEAMRAELAQLVERTPPGKLIQGTGWAEGTFGKWPSIKDLDDISPDHPVVLIEMSHHTVLMNSKAMEEFGVTQDIEDADGVVFERFEDGTLSGIILEGWHFLGDKLPKPTLESRKAAVQMAAGALNSFGVTSITEPGLNPEELEVYYALAEEGSLSLRATAHIWANDGVDGLQAKIDALPEGQTYAGTGAQNGLFNLRGIKLSIDGAPPARTAATFDDYDCCEGVRGNLTFKGANDDEREAEIMKTVALADDLGIQMGIHVTGDRSAYVAINALEAAMADNGDNAKDNANRHYLIHGDRVRDEDIARMADWNIALSTNPQITFFAGPAVGGLWGKGFGEKHMAVARFKDAGVRVSFGTDAPVVPPNWNIGMQFAVTRVGIDGQPNGAQYVVGIEDAIRAHTIEAAYQDHADDVKGSLEVGKLADIAIFDTDFLTVDAAAISQSKALLTMVDGKVVFDPMGMTAN